MGFEKSIQALAAGLLLNVNALTSAFYNEVLVSELIDQLSAFWSKSNDPVLKAPCADRNVAVLERFLKGVKVRAIYTPYRFYTIWGIPRVKLHESDLFWVW